MKTIVIIGLGNFGYALLKHFDVKNRGEYSLKAYDRNPEVIYSLINHQKHLTLFPSVRISKQVSFSSSLESVASDADYIILAVSSNAFVEVMKKLRPYLRKKVVLINTSKALEYETGERFSIITKNVLTNKYYSYALLAGGTIAKDLFKSEPLGADIACEDAGILKDLSQLFNSYNLSIYPTIDLRGVEYASAFKNVVSILAGIIKGMGFSYGSETYVISRAADEIEDLVVHKLGGKAETFKLGTQSWGNDLWMSCTGPTRNREFGELIGKYKSVKSALKQMEKKNKTVEGVYTIKALHKLADLKFYPLLNFLSNYFHGKTDLEEIKKIIFNHDF